MLLNLAKGEYPPLDRFLYVTFNSRDDWRTSNPDLARRLVRALWRAQTLMREKPSEAREEVRKFFPKMEQSYFDLAWEGSRFAFPSTPEVRREQIERALKFLADTEGTALAIDIDKAFTSAYVDAAAKSMQ